MKLLLIEDDKNLLAALSTSLRRLYAVEVAETLANGTLLLQLNAYDLVIADINLPDGNGLDICPLLSTLDHRPALLILTAEQDSVVESLDAGADDYLRKPFQVEELLARARTLLRRQPGHLLTQLQNEDLTFEPESWSVIRNNQRHRLGRKPFEILLYLSKNAHRTVSRDELYREIWDSAESIFSNTLDVHIKRIRDTLDIPPATRLIHTVAGKGFRYSNDLKGGGSP